MCDLLIRQTQAQRPAQSTGENTLSGSHRGTGSGKIGSPRMRLLIFLLCRPQSGCRAARGSCNACRSDANRSILHRSNAGPLARRNIACVKNQMPNPPSAGSCRRKTVTAFSRVSPGTTKHSQNTDRQSRHCHSPRTLQVQGLSPRQNRCCSPRM